MEPVQLPLKQVPCAKSDKLCWSTAWFSHPHMGLRNALCCLAWLCKASNLYLLCQVYKLCVTLALNKHPKVALGRSFDLNPLPLSQVKNRFLSLVGRYVIYTKWNSLDSWGEFVRVGEEEKSEWAMPASQKLLNIARGPIAIVINSRIFEGKNVW